MSGRPKSPTSWSSKRKPCASCLFQRYTRRTSPTRATSRARRKEPLLSLEEYLEREHGEERFSDLYLQTRLSARELGTRLIKLENEAHTLLQEQGIEVLYLALGFLEWYEDEAVR